MDTILHHFETVGNHGLLVFTGESFQGFLGGAGFRPSTVMHGMQSAWSALRSGQVGALCLAGRLLARGHGVMSSALPMVNMEPDTKVLEDHVSFKRTPCQVPG